MFCNVSCQRAACTKGGFLAGEGGLLLGDRRAPPVLLKMRQMNRASQPRRRESGEDREAQPLKDRTQAQPRGAVLVTGDRFRELLAGELGKLIFSEATQPTCCGHLRPP